MRANFPVVDRNHLVSSASKQLFAERSPSEWEQSEQPGGTDFGFDYSMQVAPGGEVSYTFRAQLKSTESPDLSADGRTFAVQLKRTTLNMYANCQEDVMLVLADLRLGENGKCLTDLSKVYWTWLGPEIKRIFGSRHELNASEQNEFTVHVPVVQELTPSTNVVHHLQRRVSEARAIETLTDLAREARVVPAGAEDPIQRLAAIAIDRPLSFFGQSDADGDDARDDGEPARAIAQVLSLVRVGQTTAAERALEEALEELGRPQLERSPESKAALLSVEGKIAIQRRHRVQALTLFEQAYDAFPSERHLLAREEVRFLAAINAGDKLAIAAVATSLEHVATNEGLSLLVRVQVAQGQFAAARATVGKIGAGARAMPLVVALSGEHRWPEVREEVGRALGADKLRLQDKMGLRLVAARACWIEAVEAAHLAPDVEELPLSGAPGLDLEAATAAWTYARDCLLDLRKLAWQPNVELLAPIAMASAAATGKHEEAIGLLKEAAAARPEYQELQESLEILAIGAGDIEVAMGANLRQSETTAVLVRRACLQFQAKQLVESVNTALRCLSDLDESVKQTPMALAMGSAAATKLGRGMDVERFVGALQANPWWDEYLAFASFAQESMLRGTVDDVPLEALRAGLRRHPESRLLMANLYSNLSLDDDAPAEEVVALARRLRVEASLSDKDSDRLILAYLQLKRWDDAEREVRAFVQRFGENARVLSLLAISLEMQSRTGASLEAFERALSMGKSRSSTLRNYLGLCLRLGRAESAQETVEKLLAVESDRSERLDLLRLQALLLTQLDRGLEAYAVVKTLGLAVDREVEVEEGMYVNVFMASTLSMQLPDEEREAIRLRMETFSAKWPDSAIFKIVTTQGDLSASKVEAMLENVLGNSPKEVMRGYRERENDAREGRLPVPFVARPSFVFHYIGDVFTLWDCAKRSRPEDKQFHLTCALIEQAIASDRVLRDVPILDLTALLVLRDLGLFDQLFKLFPQIAIPRHTVDYISQNARGVFPNRLAASYAKPLLAFINDNLQRIDQPSLARAGGTDVNPKELLDDYLSLAKSGKWVAYSDDAITRAWIAAEKSSVLAMSTLDLFRFADESGSMSPTEIGSHIVQLSTWNVQVVVVPRYFLATLDGALDGTRGLNVSDRWGRFLNHAPFTSLARALWNVEKDPNELVGHIGRLVAELLKEPSVEEDSVAALWAFWFNRLRIAPKTLALGWNLLYCSLIIGLIVEADGTERRLVHNMLKVAEAILGKDATSLRMDQVVRELGICVGVFGNRNYGRGEFLRSRIALALTPGTHEGDLFANAYLSSIEAKSA